LVKGKYGNIIDNKMIRNKTESDKLTHKLYFQFNSAYVESLAYHLVSNLTEKNICPHFPLIYGVYNGCAKNFYTEFTEEYKQVYNLSTYQEGEKKGYFNIVDPNDNFNCNFDLDIDTISLENENSFTLNNKLINKDLLYLQIKNCPVQIIAMETYEHTLQDIMNSDFEDINTLFLRLNMCENNYVNKFCYKLLYQYKSKKMEKKYFALLFQVVMALCCCQSKYDMCHNDLHIQNIMVKLTHEEYLFYKFENRYFKVPTYGYIVKIIDFGRATFTLNDTFYIGDVFKYSSEAGEQYSYPYSHWKSKKNIPPNKHFDLCRLACSIIEDYYQVKPDTLHPLKEISKGHYETVSPLYNMLCEWSTDKYHQSVMRFDNFDLYKIIARRASHSLPASQTRNKYFSNFKIKKNDIPPKAWVYCIV
jgi:hypothetical protein